MKLSHNEIIIPIKTSGGKYNIHIGRRIIKNFDKLISVNSQTKALIVTDDGVPVEYAQSIAEKIADSYIVSVPNGENSKNLLNFEKLLKTMVENDFTRSDIVIAVGGGVVGDLAGFVASTYMRGVDFYNIPTTVLSQVDSSVGGKTAVNFMGLKNIVGAFYPPKKVIIDLDVLKTLSKRQVSNGLAESLKMSLTSDKSLFEIFENEDIYEHLEEIINRSIQIKSAIVEEDEKESGLRRVLNFGHTLAHGIESVNDFNKYYHGECVSLGMLPMCAPKVRDRLIEVLKKLELPYELPSNNIDLIIDACKHDKKMSGNEITVVYVPEIGEFELRKMSFLEYENMIRQALK